MVWVNDVIQGILIGGLYALFACGLSLMFGVMKVVNLAHGDLAIIGGYIAVGVIAVTHIPVLWSFVIVVPLMAVLFIEGWRRRGEEVITGTMIAWTVAAWLSMIALEVPWNWLKLGGPMTWVLLLLAPASFSLVRSVSMKHAATS